ncbi:hypothetical protein CXF68_00175 [Tenacibaculum sp. Bg11-29]|uniref:hypothetical protein n=1 Tax=Tenacibaculum sp. Bg11-29 TaxID=2058306 RepID=UPI000C337357|nr:hypothetical protein [Tenacibaculum sp. Bg11-29]PKH49196.1 hypothetical protein CXF68_00175 [Tenacibaculum sp. Bg11-29]
MYIHLKIIGVLLTLLAFLHIGFSKYFNWKEELSTLSLINQQMMKVHTFFIAFVVFLIGVLCFTLTEEIIETNLGRKIAFGLSLFWFVRLVFQLFVYSPMLWKGKIFETIMHVLFTLFWVYLSVVFFIIYLN